LCFRCCETSLRETTMKRKFLIAALLAGLASPAAASTVLDFTTTAIGTSNTMGTTDFGVGYEITGGGGALKDATHWNNVGCGALACDGGNRKYDVGFGIDARGNDNSNEVDLTGSEYVQVAFKNLVRVIGFAGMLTYNRNNGNGFETVILEYSSDGGSIWQSLVASATFKVNESGTNFDTVGIAELSGFSVEANVVRFRAGGQTPFDDGNSNITASALEVAPVPVPAALPLLAAALGAFGIVGMRRKRANAA
jgi:hypothetical protein